MNKTLFILSFLTCNYVGVLSNDFSNARQLRRKSIDQDGEQNGLQQFSPRSSRSNKSKEVYPRRVKGRKTQTLESKGKGKGKGGKGKGWSRAPSPPKPTPFDISDCSTYSNQWIVDMHSTCIGDPLENNFQGCECKDAQRRIENGEISCDTVLCPDDCEVCKSCLYYVIDDCVNSKTSPPTRSPTPEPSTRSPTSPPTRSPTPEPSTRGRIITPAPAPTPIVTDTFDISVCSSYNLIWLLDIRISCIGKPEDNDFRGCVCSDAQRRIDNGQINCNVRDCPKDCDVCVACMENILDCD